MRARAVATAARATLDREARPSRDSRSADANMRLGAAPPRQWRHSSAGAACRVPRMSGRPASSGAACQATAKRIVALDFDGVICDSVGESSLSAFKVGRGGGAARMRQPQQAQALGSEHPAASTQAAAILWPEVFATEEAEAKKEELVEKMRAVRPVVETG